MFKSKTFSTYNSNFKPVYFRLIDQSRLAENVQYLMMIIDQWWGQMHLSTQKDYDQKIGEYLITYPQDKSDDQQTHDTKVSHLVCSF